jgi:hypothetical protein
VIWGNLSAGGSFADVTRLASLIAPSASIRVWAALKPQVDRPTRISGFSQPGLRMRPAGEARYTVQTGIIAVAIGAGDIVRLVDVERIAT